ncbi:MAG: hypothetical protein AABZ15_05625 [Nitrospirota bacterium]
MFKDRFIYPDLPAVPPQAPYFTPEWSMAAMNGQYCLDAPNAAKLKRNVESLIEDNTWLRGMIRDMQKQKDEMTLKETKKEQAEK